MQCGKRTRTNPTGEVKTKISTKGAPECASVENKSKQIAQIVQALTPIWVQSARFLDFSTGGPAAWLGVGAFIATQALVGMQSD